MSATFWQGFEKRAHGGGPIGGITRFFKNIGESAKNIKLFTRQMSSPDASKILSNIGETSKSIRDMSSTASKFNESAFVRDVGSAAKNFNALSAEVRKTNNLVTKTIPQVEERIDKAMDYVKDTIVPEINVKADRGLEYLKKGLLGVTGLYAASKAMTLPGEYHKYKYYKANQNLANQRLKEKGKGPLPVMESPL